MCIRDREETESSNVEDGNGKEDLKEEEKSETVDVAEEASSDAEESSDSETNEEEASSDEGTESSEQDEKTSAEEAESWGLVNRIVSDEDIEAQTLKLAQQLADGAPNAAGTAKAVIYKGYESNLREAGDFEALNIVRAAGTRTGQEGIAAFVEKRAPEWNE